MLRSIRFLMVVGVLAYSGACDKADATADSSNQMGFCGTISSVIARGHNADVSDSTIITFDDGRVIVFDNLSAKPLYRNKTYVVNYEFFAHNRHMTRIKELTNATYCGKEKLRNEGSFAQVVSTDSLSEPVPDSSKK